MQEPYLFWEEGAKLEAVFMSEEAYAAALDAFIIVCVDFIPLNHEQKVVYLAKRAVEPGKGYWFFGGRRKAGEDMRAAIVRLAARETGLTLESKRFNYLCEMEYLWKVRKQAPHENGSHNLSHTFTIELSDAEIKEAATHLDPEEYDLTFGIEPFSRERLLEVGAREPILTAFDLIFPR